MSRVAACTSPTVRLGASISTPLRLYDYIAIHRDLSWILWWVNFSNYKYLVDTPDFERWQAASQPIIPHSRLPPINFPAIISARSYTTSHHQSLKDYSHQLLFSLSECSSSPRSSWHLLSSATPCLRSPSRKSCQQKASQPQPQNLAAPNSPKAFLSEKHHHRNSTYQEITIRESPPRLDVRSAQRLTDYRYCMYTT